MKPADHNKHSVDTDKLTFFGSQLINIHSVDPDKLTFFGSQPINIHSVDPDKLTFFWKPADQHTQCRSR